MNREDDLLNQKGPEDTKKSGTVKTGIISMDISGYILDSNDNALKILENNSKKSIKGRKLYDYLTPGELDAFKTEVKHSHTLNSTRTATVIIKRTSGEKLKVFVVIAPWLNENASDKVVIMIDVLRTLTSDETSESSSYDQAVEGLKGFVGFESEEEREHKRIQKGQDVFMFTIDETGLCKSWNEYCWTFFGYKNDEVIDKKMIFDFIDHAQIGGLKVVLKAALSSGKEFDSDIKFSLNHEKGGVRMGHLTVTKIFDFQETGGGYLCMFYPLDPDSGLSRKSPRPPQPSWSGTGVVPHETFPVAEQTGEIDQPAVPAIPLDTSVFDVYGQGGGIEFDGYKDVAIVGNDGGIKFVTENFIQELGFSSLEEIRDHNWFEFMNEEPVKDIFDAALAQSEESERPGPFRLPYRTKEGAVIETDLRVIPIRDRNGCLTEALWLLNKSGLQTGVEKQIIEQDRVELAVYENALLQLNSDLVAANIISGMMIKSSDLHEFVMSVLDTVTGTIYVEYAALFLIKDSKLHLEYSIGLSKEAERNQFSYNSNQDDAKDKILSIMRTRSETGIVSHLVSPITYNDSTFGFIAFASPQDIEFTNMDHDLVNTASNQLAHAIKYFELLNSNRALNSDFKNFYDNNPDMYMTIKSDGTISNFNNTTLKILDCTYDELSNQNLMRQFRTYLGDEFTNFQSWIKTARDSKELTETQIKIKLKTGESLYFNVRAVPGSKVSESDQNGLLLIFRNITDQYRDQAFLKNSNDIMEQILNSMDDVIIYFDRDNKIIECNERVNDYLGYERDELQGQPSSVLYANDLLRERYFTKMNEIYSGSNEVKIEQVIRRKNGSMFIALATACPLKNNTGTITGMALYLSDITTQKRSEKELEEAKKETSFYVNILSNDFKNYNKCALGYLKLLKQTALEPQQNNFIDIIIEQVESCNRMSNNIQKIYSISDGKTKLSTVDLNRVIRGTASNLFEKTFSNRNLGNLDLKINYPEAVYGVKADMFLEELFSNLFWNAVQHNTHDEKKLEIDIHHSDENPESFWQIEISDNAFGISDDQKELLLESNVDNDLKNDACGFGMSIIKALVDRYGGKLWIENRVKDDYKQGSIFKLMLKKASMPVEDTYYGFGAHT